MTKWYLLRSACASPPPHSLYSLTVIVTDAHSILQLRSHFITNPLCVSPAPRVYRLNDPSTTLRFIVAHHAIVTISDTRILDAGRADFDEHFFGYLGDFIVKGCTCGFNNREFHPDEFLNPMEHCQDFGQTLTSTNA